MVARPYWQGQIRLALVSIAVEVCPATRSGAAISFHQIHEPTGKRVRYEKVVPGLGPVDRDEILKGFEFEKGHCVLLDEAEIEAVQIESRKTLELVQFVDTRDIDVLYYEKPYFILPADDLAEEAYGVLREALRQTGKAGLGQLSVRGREQLVAVRACGKGLILEVLRYADEVAKAQTAFRALPAGAANAELVDMASTLIDKRSGPFAPETFRDHYIDALQRLIEKKRKAKGGKRILDDVEETGGAGGGNVIDLMAALKRSVGSSDGPAAKPAATRSGLDWTDRFPTTAKALAGADLPAALIDGEVVALDTAHNPSFSALKDSDGARFAYFALDLLNLAGQDLKPRPNIERKARLAALLAAARPPLHLAEHEIGARERLYRAMCKAGQEGVIAKRADAPYRGDRSRNWLKIKCSLRQEFVIVASTAPGRPFGALLVAQREGDALVYKGKVGTGFDADRLEQLAGCVTAASLGYGRTSRPPK